MTGFHYFESFHRPLKPSKIMELMDPDSLDEDTAVGGA